MGLQDGEEEHDGWRVVLLRALIQGDVALTASVLWQHIDVLSLPFTNAMPTWKLQWETIYWWMLRDPSGGSHGATPLFIASAFAHAPLVQWLLDHGADRQSKCYLKKTPIDFVGECCGHADAKAIEACRLLLMETPRVPLPPNDNLVGVCHVASDLVVTKSELKLQQTLVHKCLVELTWDTPCSNGAMIEKYEVRYRNLVSEDEEQEQEDDEDDEFEDEQDKEAREEKKRKRQEEEAARAQWRTERTNHNRKTTTQRLMLEGLQFGTGYELMLRSWNAVGKGEWGNSLKLKTVQAPDDASNTAMQPPSCAIGSTTRRSSSIFSY